MKERSSFLQITNDQKMMKSAKTEDWTYHQVFGTVVVDESIGKYYWQLCTSESFYGRLAIIDYGNFNRSEYSFEDTLFEHTHVVGCGSANGWYVGTQFGNECSALSKFFKSGEDVKIQVSISDRKVLFENVISHQTVEISLPTFTRKVKLVVETIVRSCDCYVTIVESGPWVD
ncbi:hypothetical protein RFI_07801 [Reticulomyxa filosa]|uniref:Uncharacterized protein n=1 Tax=Reticulomyxa filosa TaxID=46433 RepID=X6NVL1_RETFI|nr:hypothetical protein RFI_07801 [Reticulomyxa filosa]|eukprot:ETO29322.1 hypothetical protein RFI_07801 [Reticulomyxa filosa]